MDAEYERCTAKMTWQDFRDYEPSVEDGLYFQEFWSERQAAHEGFLAAKVIEETDTRDESAPRPFLHFPAGVPGTPLHDAIIYAVLEAA